MMLKIQFLSALLFLTAALSHTNAKYEPDWTSLDNRPLPGWFDEAKIGIFIHWGVYSVPSYDNEWFWNRWKTGSKNVNNYIEKNFPPGFSYQEFAKDFTAEFFNPTKWVELFKKAGAKYVVLTSKHHEGFAMWPSKYSFSWNAKDVGPHRDVVGELGEAVRKANLTYGLYHSLLEWYHPWYEADKSNNFTTQTFVDNKVMLEMKELVNNYKPSLIWSDGEWEAPDTYWKSKEFIAWLYNESPVKDEVVVNDRWGNNNVDCNHGGYLTCVDRYNPKTLQKKKWENSQPIDKYSYGFRREAGVADYYSISELINILITTITCGGNILLNVGPTKEGTISPILEERLLQLGDWLQINGEAIYSSKPWSKAQNDTLNSNVWYSTRNDAVYAFNLVWPENNKVVLASAVGLFKSSGTVVTLLGNQGQLKWKVTTGQVEIELPDKAVVRSDYAWVLKISAGK